MNFKLRQYIKKTSQQLVFPLVYYLNRRRPIDPKLVLLADNHHINTPEAFRGFEEKLVEDGYTVETFYSDEREVGKLKNYFNMIRFLSEMPRAKYVFLCDYYLPAASMRKRKETTIINIWHGSGAFKKFGFNATDDIVPGFTKNPLYNTRFLFVTGHAAVEPFKNATMLKNKVVAAGSMSAEKFLDKEYVTKCREEVFDRYPKAKGKRVVLLAPSFVGNAGEGREGFSVNVAYLQELLGDNYYVIKKSHPLVDGCAALSTRKVMCAADVFVTDYSSLWFDYLLLDKPIVFFASDYKNYENGRGFYLDYKSLPGEVLVDEDATDAKLASAIKSSEGKDLKVNDRKKYRDEYMDMVDGHTYDRIKKIMGSY